MTVQGDAGRSDMKPRPMVVDLKVTLDEVEPKVLRELDVPLSLTLDRLHHVFQIVIGWTNSHFYEFRVGELRYGVPDPDDDFGNKILDAREAVLKTIIEDMQIKSFKYLYDFGDRWEHSIEVGRIERGDSQVTSPFVYKTSGRCPPEDVGGPYGYSEFLEALQNPKHQRHREFVEWWGSNNFDPTYVDREAMDWELRKIKSRWTRQDRANKA